MKLAFQISFPFLFLSDMGMWRPSFLPFYLPFAGLRQPEEAVDHKAVDDNAKYIHRIPEVVQKVIRNEHVPWLLHTGPGAENLPTIALGDTSATHQYKHA